MLVKSFRAGPSVQLDDLAIPIVDEFAELRKPILSLLKEFLPSGLRMISGFQLFDECVDSLDVLRDLCILCHGHVNSHNPSMISRSTTRTAMIAL